MTYAKGQWIQSRTIDMSGSLILDADANINNTIVRLRGVLAEADYEFVVTDRGTQHRVWLAQQPDVQLLTVNDDREVDRLLSRMARHEERLVLKNGEWSYRRDDVTALPSLTKTKSLAARRSDSNRILHVSSFPENTRGITEALRHIGEVETFNWREILNGSDADAMNSMLKKRVLEYEPRLIFMEECFTGDVWPDTIRSIKTGNTVCVVNWCGDIRHEIPASMLAMAPMVDWTMLSNQPQVRELEMLGHQAVLLPSGCATEVYHKVAPDHEKYPADIVFLGSGRKRFPLDSLREQMVWALYKRYGSRFRVYGRGWKRKGMPFVYDYAEPEEEEALLYSSCKVAIGVSAFDWPQYTSARMWKAMGSGACYLPYYFQGIEQWFGQQDHLAWWRTLPELFSLIDYYLGNESERERVALAGMREVHSNHSWVARMEAMNRISGGRGVKVW